MATPSPIPPPRPDDDEDVHWALSTASALWARGDAAESIKWLRRAAETASDQNRDQRSLELFKAAADATSLVRPAAPTGPLPTLPANPAPPAPARPPVGPMGTLSMQIPPGLNQPPLGPPPGPGQSMQAAGQGSGQSPPPPMVRPSAPMPPPQASPSPQGRAPVPQRTSVPGPQPGAGGPPAGTARAAASQANAQAQAVRAPGFSPQRPAASPLPAAVGNARQLLKATLPSEGATGGAVSRPVPAARPSPGTGAGAPSSAAKRSDAKKQPLDARFQFPDEEVTVQRDLAALKRPRPVHTDLAEDAAASAATLRAPVVTAPPVARTLISTTPGSAAAAGAGGATVRGLQPVARQPAAEAVAHAIANEPTDHEHEHTPLDDLDEQTSVLAGDEADLEFEGSATGETSAAMLASIEQNAIDRSQLADEPGDEPDDVDDANLDEGVTGEESSDPRHGGLSVPSVRPEPMPRPAALPAVATAAHRDRSKSAWTSVRVAVRRDASGVRVEALARGARPAPGAIAAVLVAQDDATAEALAKLLDG